MRVGSGGVLALAVALATIGGLLLIADTAQAVGEDVEVIDDFRDVLQGASTRMQVTFGSGDTQETVMVDCRQANCGGPFTRTIEFDANKDNCDRFGDTNRRFCIISFPEGFTDPQGTSAAVLGEPSRRQAYDVRVESGVGDDPTDSFQAWLTTASVCRSQEAWRHDILRISSTGHPSGQQVQVRVIDRDRGVTVVDQTRVSSGPGAPITVTWEIPLDYPLGADDSQTIRIEVEADGVTDAETVPLLPGSPVVDPVVELRPTERGQDPDPDFMRTETVRYYFRMFYFSAPVDCPHMSHLRKVTPVDGSVVPDDTLRVRVEQVDTATSIEQERSETVAHPRSVYVGPLQQFWINHTIDKDAEATRGGTGQPDNPLYKITVDDQVLLDGNRIREFASPFYRVHPYVIEPRIERLPGEVERLERADVSFNLTYADGSPFTPNDTDDRIQAELRQVGAGEPKEVNELEYTGDGLWNTTKPINMTFEPLGEYRWILRAAEDRYGDTNHHNEIPRTPTQIFDIVVARPLLDLKTFVGSEEVNGTERTQTVHVTLHAEYKDGRPLTSDNVDPSLGGVMLNVKKTNQFGRVLEVDSLLMTDADEDGGWVRTFRVPKTASGAPVGTWDLEAIAGDDRDPSNKNVTAFPFEVEPAKINVRPVVPPPDLLDGDQEDLRYVTRLTYPDGSLFTEEMANPERGGEITVDLVRLNFLNEPRTEVSQRPTGIQGGQEWEFELDAAKAIPGNHFFNVTGQDIHGNLVGPSSSKVFTILFNGEFRNSTSPICPGNASIDADDAQCSRQRGSDLFALFPSSPGDEGIFTEEPIINVLRRPEGGTWQLYRQDVAISQDRFLELSGEEAGQNHVGYFETDTSTPTGTYMFTIIGRGEDDVGFGGFSVKFSLSAVDVEREVIQAPPDEVDKGERITAILARQAGDVVDEAVVRAGPVTFRNVEVTPASGVGTFIRWTPPRSAPTGPLVIDVDGRDVFGNGFSVSLGPIDIAASEIRASTVEDPPTEAPRLSNVRLESKLVFEDGQAYTSTHGTPEVRILDEDSEIVDTGRARFFEGRWFLEWSPRYDIPVGQYRFEIGGQDSSGNIIQTFVSRPFQVMPGTVDADSIDNPDEVTRGQTARAEFEFPSEIRNLTATVSTGATGIGEPRLSFNGTTAQATFTTDRTTELVVVRFLLKGEDVYGNEIDASTQLFQIDPQRMSVRFLDQPPDNVQKGERVVVDFVVLYPDGTRMRPGEGTPIAGMFARDQPLGPLRPEPRENDPTVWRITWDPPEDVRTDIPYRFAVSALDRWQNEAPPSQTQGFFIANPVVPDYLPVPAVNPVAILAMLGAAAAMLGRDRWRGDDPPP